MALTPAQKALLIAGFLSTGFINTLTKKWQMLTCSPTRYPLNADEQKTEGCKDDTKEFNKPWTQNIQMLFGEALVFSVFLVRRPARIQQAREVGEEKKPRRHSIFLCYLLVATSWAQESVALGCCSFPRLCGK